MNSVSESDRGLLAARARYSSFGYNLSLVLFMLWIIFNADAGAPALILVLPVGYVLGIYVYQWIESWARGPEMGESVAW